MLAKRFEHILHDLGMAGLEHPLFYHAPVGIRFKIGGEEPIYLDRRAAKLKTNPAYVQGALDRAAAIYRALPAVPDLLRIDGYPDEEPAESLLTVIRQRVGLPVPDEQLSATEQDEDGDTHAQVQFYWDLSKISFQPELLLRGNHSGDIGGWNGFVSSSISPTTTFHRQDEDGDTHAQVQFYWDLSKISFQPELFFGKSFWGTSAAGTALCPASIWLGRGRSSTICTMTVGWMCWAAHRSCYCLSIINFMTGFWNTIWRRLTRCSLQQKE